MVNGVDEYGGIHTAAKINDGHFGNASSWIGKTDGSFVGVRFAQAARINRLAFGRDNSGRYTDRCRGKYLIQFTNVSSPDASTTDSHWQTIGQLDYVSEPPPLPSRRNVYSFEEVNATAVRIIPQSIQSSECLAIDELEVYGPGSADLLKTVEAEFDRSLPRPRGVISATNLVGVEQYGWLDQQAEQMVALVRMRQGDGPTMYSPGGEYIGLWARDFFYLAHNVPEFVPAEHVHRICELMVRHQLPNGMVPISLSLDGTGARYVCWGPPPESDSSQFFVKLAFDYFKRSGDKEFVATNLKAMARAMDAMPRDELGLVWIDPKSARTPYGFTDQIVKTGSELYCSLLYWEVAQQLSEMANAVGDLATAQEFKHRAGLIEKNLANLWHEEKGAFLAASEDSRQIDIWGNAYLVCIGFPDPPRRERVSRFLAKNYDRIVYAGQVRHLLQGEYWEITSQPIAKDEYQNGAFWGTASGWVAYAIAQGEESTSSTFHSGPTL